MPRLEVSKHFGVWSQQLLMNVNIDTRVFNLYMFIWVRFALLFRGGRVESTFSPESDQTAVGPDQSLWLSLSLSFFWVFVTAFLLQAEDFIVLFTTLSFYACFS